MSQVTQISSEFATITQSEISAKFSPVRTNFTTIQTQHAALTTIDAALRVGNCGSTNKSQH
jgi:hypothetical protein